MNKWIAIALLVAGCKQGLGDHCQTNNDCTEGICSATKHLCVAVGTSTDDDIDAPPEPTGFRSFTFLASVNTALTTDVIACPTRLMDGGIKDCGTLITASVPAGTDRVALVATFEANGLAVYSGNKPQISGNAPNNFTGPVVYTIIGVDGAMQNVTVMVTAP